MPTPDWTSRGKSVAQLIEELRTFEDQGMEVRISIDGGATSLPISLVGKSEGKFAVLKNCQDTPTPIRHEECSRSGQSALAICPRIGRGRRDYRPEPFNGP